MTLARCFNSRSFHWFSLAVCERLEALAFTEGVPINPLSSQALLIIMYHRAWCAKDPPDKDDRKCAIPKKNKIMCLQAWKWATLKSCTFLTLNSFFTCVSSEDLEKNSLILLEHVFVCFGVRQLVTIYFLVFWKRAAWTICKISHQKNQTMLERHEQGLKMPWNLSWKFKINKIMAINVTWTTFFLFSSYPNI